MRLTLRELGHPQPPSPINCEDATATGIANGTIKRQISRSIEERYLYICELVKHNEVQINLHLGQENLG